MTAIRVTAPAKINLFLHITGKRGDGYHLLESLAAFTEFGDTLEISHAEALTLDVAGPFAASLGQGADNSVMKAAQLLKTHTEYRTGAHIILKKNLPVGAGIGSGSSDAAAALSGLQKLWNVAVDNASLQTMALQLGSDVPVCLTRQAAWMQGIGERITPLDMQADAWMVLVNPGFPLLTADVFRRFSGTFALAGKIPQAISSFEELISLIYLKENMLETAAVELMPLIADMLAAIQATQGCRLARMSGSGATCFGLYNNAEAAEQAALEIKRRCPTWWSIAGKLLKKNGSKA